MHYGGSLYLPMCKNLKLKNEKWQPQKPHHTTTPRATAQPPKNTTTQPQQAIIIIAACDIFSEELNNEQSANIPGNLKLWSKNTHTGQIYPGLRHTINFFPATVKIFLATVTVATLIFACNTHHGHIRIRVLLQIRTL